MRHNSIPLLCARATSLKIAGPSVGPGGSLSLSLSRSRSLPVSPLPSGPLKSSSSSSSKLGSLGLVLRSLDNVWRSLPKQVPSSMPRDVKSIRAAINLSMRELIMSIWLSASYRFDRRHGFLTAVICFDSVIDEQSPFGAPKFSIWRR